MLEACISAYAQTVPMCPGNHWRRLDNGGRERVTGSALTRILRSPNDYQTISDFLMNLTRRLYVYGEAFAYAVRNSRFEIVELHLMRRGQAWVGAYGDVFYSLAGNEIIEKRVDLSTAIPARDVLHVKLETPVHPLRGVSPILAAAPNLAMATAAQQQQIAFYLNQARPSFVIQTDQQLKEEQIEQWSEKWNRKTQGENAGRTPFLAWGFKAQPISTSAVDSQLVEMLRMTDEKIALTLRIPLQILGVGGTTYANTELLMGSWVSTGLGFTLNHIEEAFGALFGLRGVPDEYLELDTKALLRSAHRDRIETLARGVITGIYSPDEARSEEDLPAVPGGVGKEPRVQQQVVPLSYGVDMKPPDPNKPPATPPQADPNAPADPNEPPDPNQQNAWLDQIIDAADEFERRAA
jgi:HK97 family phage portal protein